MRIKEPGPPVFGPRQVLTELVSERAEPHQFVNVVGRRERNRNNGHDHEHGETAARGFRAGVFAEANVGNDRHERCADEVSRAPDREHFERRGQELDSAAHDPETDDDEQHADWPAAYLALGRNEAQAQQYVAGGAENQQYGQCDIEVHQSPIDLTKSANDVTCRKRLIPGTGSQL